MIDEVEITERARERQTLARLNADKDLESVASSAQGRRFLFRLIYEISGIDKDASLVIDRDVAIGEQRVGKRLLSEMQRACPHHVRTMLNERFDEIENAARAASQEQKTGPA